MLLSHAAVPSNAAPAATSVARFIRPSGLITDGAPLQLGNVPPQKGHTGSQTRWCRLQCGHGSS
jgi:hypothetical protein